MLNLLGKRLLQLIPTLFFVSVIIFSLQQLLPGDPALIMLLGQLMLLRESIGQVLAGDRLWSVCHRDLLL